MKAKQAVSLVNSMYNELNQKDSVSSKELEALKVVLESAKEFHTQFMWDIEKELDGRENINIITQGSNLYSTELAKRFGIEYGNNGFIKGKQVEEFSE